MFESRIRIDPEIRHGKPVIKGIILGSLAGGMGAEAIAKEYRTQKEDVLAAIEYAAKIIASEEIKVYA